MRSTDNNNHEICIATECANCGKGEEESNKLKACGACKMVRYCSTDCQQAHRPQHKKECRRRVKELHDEELFKQPPPKEDCPICFIRLPSLGSGSTYYACCGKVICSGCCYATVYDYQGNEVDNNKCPFCRTPAPDSDEEIVKRTMKRVEMNDPIAIYNIGVHYRDGRHGFPQDYTKALELFRRAGELGDTEAYTNVGYAYNNGRGAEIDKRKAVHYYELAAIGGDVSARHNLGIVEYRGGNIDRALKHFLIGAGGGHGQSLKKIQELYSDGHAAKDDYKKALQSYQAYLGEIKSKQRDEAADEDHRYY